MNEEDKKRFARYKPGYIEPEFDENQDEINLEKTKQKIGYINKVEINPNELINKIITESKLNKPISKSSK
jgi:hypothetical protein